MITKEFKDILSMQRIEYEFSKMLENINYYASLYILYKYKYLDYMLDINEFKSNVQTLNDNNY